MSTTTPEITLESVLGMKVGNLANVNPDFANLTVEAEDLQGIDFSSGSVVAVIIARVAKRWGSGSEVKARPTFDNEQWERSDFEV